MKNFIFLVSVFLGMLSIKIIRDVLAIRDGMPKEPLIANARLCSYKIK